MQFGQFCSSLNRLQERSFRGTKLQAATFLTEMQCNPSIGLTVIKNAIYIKHPMNSILSKSHVSIVTGF